MIAAGGQPANLDSWMENSMSVIRQLLTAAVFLTIANGAKAQDSSLTTDAEKYSYTAGYRIGEQIKARLGQDSTEIDKTAFLQGVSDVFEGAASRLTEDEMRAAVESVQNAQAEARTRLAQENQKASDSFLADNKGKDGVVTTNSGLQYRVLTQGEGDNPGPDATVVVHYRGTLIDGSEFDSSYSRGTPATFALNGIIPGWQEALQLMRPGGKWEVIIPPALGYGENGAGAAIGPNQALIFEIELLEVK